MLNRPSNINKDAIDRRPQVEFNVPLNEFPTVMETRKAFQHGRETDRVVSLYVEEGGYSIRIYRCIHNPTIQAERKSCDNYRGISLLSIAGKILLNRLNDHFDKRKSAWIQIREGQ